MRSISFIKRTTFSAWSLMMTTFGLVIAAMLPYCGIIGRSVLTSSFESTYCAAITRVTSSSPAISLALRRVGLPLCLASVCC